MKKSFVYKGVAWSWVKPDKDNISHTKKYWECDHNLKDMAHDNCEKCPLGNDVCNSGDYEVSKEIEKIYKKQVILKEIEKL